MSASRNPYFLDLLEIKIVELGSGRGVLSLAVQQKHLRSLGIMHGGVIASLLDTAMGMSVTTVAPPDHYSVTAQLNINFIRPAWPGETLIATAQVPHVGRQTAVANAEVRTDKGVLVSTATGTFMFLPHDEHSREKIEKLPDPVLPG